MFFLLQINTCDNLNILSDLFKRIVGKRVLREPWPSLPTPALRGRMLS
jgi:hypothetical protein